MKRSLFGLVIIAVIVTSCNRFNKTYNEIPPLPQGGTDFSKQNLKVINQMIKEDDENDELYWQRSILYQKEGNAAEALKDIKKAVSLNNEKYHYYKTLAQAFLLNKKYDSAIIAASFSRDAGNNDFQLSLILAEAYLHKGEVKKSMAEIATALAIDPNFYHSYYLRGLAHKGLRDTASAYSDFRKALTLNPDKKEIYDELLEYHLTKSDLNSADAILAKMFNKFTPDVRMFKQKGHFYEIQQKYDSAYKFYSAAIQLDSSSYELSLKTGNIKFKKNEFSEAVPHFKNVLKYKQDNFEAQYKLGLCYESLKYYPEASSEYERALSIDSSNATVKADLLRVNVRIKRREEIEEAKRIREQQRKVILLPDISNTPNNNE